MCGRAAGSAKTQNHVNAVGQEKLAVKGWKLCSLRTPAKALQARPGKAVLLVAPWEAGE